MSKLAPYEKETIIIFNEEDGNAEITTHNKKLINRLKKYVKEGQTVNFIKRLEDGAYKFEIPKEWIIRLSVPRKLNLNEQQKKERAARLKKVL